MKGGIDAGNALSLPTFCRTTESESAVVNKPERPNSGDSPKPGAASHSPIANAAPGDPTTLYDSNLRLALSLIGKADWDQLAARTGIERFSPDPQFLSLFVEIERDKFEQKEKSDLDAGLLVRFELLLPTAYANEFRINKALRTFAVRIALMDQNPALTANGTPLETLLANLAASGLVRRLRIAIPHGQCLERSLDALDLPPANIYKQHELTGRDIVIGIIDDGCALAHPDFLTIDDSTGARSYRSRILTLWDQSQPATNEDVTAGWTAVNGFNYGRELPQAAIDAMLAKHASALRVDEDAVYNELRYEVGAPDELATHGTKVMGIAAGNGNSMMGWHGVAPEADIIFVQLPPYSVKHAPKLLSDKIVHAAHFIFQRALEMNKQAAVVNISYGGYAGPHDGTSAWEMAIDELLTVTNRAVVVSAGNAFEADCHAMGSIKKAAKHRLHWVLNPFDTTRNDLEIWYDGAAALELMLEMPDGSQTFGPFPFCPRTDLQRKSDGAIIGSVEHVQNDPTNGDNSILIALGPTMADSTAPKPLASVASGTWIVRLRNIGTVAAEFHGWIQRDDLGKTGAHQQSHFAAGDAHPAYTLGDFSTGKLTISTGAFNAATSEVSPYSSCGPTRASAGNPSRQKPELLAPAEELATGGGVLTSASRQSAPHRMNGTSAAAPHVAGVVALVFDYQRNHEGQDLSAEELRAALGTQSGGHPLVPSRLGANHRHKVKQGAVWNELVGGGKISCLKTLDNL